jgi:pimeloyl-ACP methyl ester carboxylesterase
VLLHGFASTPRSLAFLARHVRVHLQRPVLRPDLGIAFADLVAAAARVETAIAASGAREVDVVGHSLGGLVASYLLKRVDCGRRVRRVITLGTPHAGTPLAWLGAIATLGALAGPWRLLPGSRFLAELAASPVPSGSELVALAGEADVVVPERCALLDTAARQCCLRLANVDHMQLVFHREVLARVGELLGAADPLALGARAAAQRARRDAAGAAQHVVELAHAAEACA